MFFHTKFSAWTSFMLAYGSASTHFEKISVTTKRKRFSFELWRGPTMSMAQRMKGYGDVLEERTSAGCRMVGASLAFFAFFCEFLTISDHRWPVVSVAFDLHCKWPSTGMVSAGSRIDFFHDFSRLFSFQTRHEWSGKIPFVNFPVDCYITHGLGLDFAQPFFGR